MRKTCMNCKHFHGCLAEEEPSYYHIHNYCDAWDRTISCPMNSLINEYLDFSCCDISADELPEGLDLYVHDDIETGEASCYRFIHTDKPDFDDEWFKANFEHNKKLAICMIEKLLKENKYILDTYDKVRDEIVYKAIEMDEDTRKEYQDLLEKIKKSEF